MTNEDLTAKLAAVLMALAQGKGWSPASYIYLALGSDMQAYEVVAGFLAKKGLVKRSAEVIRITPAGRALAAKLEAQLGKE